MDNQKIARINELYHKSKAEGLTEDECKEQQLLRREYVDSFKRNLRGQLDHGEASTDLCRRRCSAE